MKTAVLTIGLLLGALSGATPARADEAAIAETLSTPFHVIAEKNRSYRVLFDALMAVTPPPAPVGPIFNQTTVWPGMIGWSKVSEWAKANAALGEAIKKAQDGVALAIPYGSQIEPKYLEAGLCIQLGDGHTLGAVHYAYLDEMRMLATYAAAEMYRLGEEGKFEEAFDLGIANLRVLRQGCDQRTIAEKSFFMETLADACSINRDFMWTYLEKIPVEVIQKASLKGYAFLRQTDVDRVKRLEMPEGDRTIQLAVLRETFGSDGQADSDKFAKVWGTLQSKNAPLSRFGAAKFWRLVSSVHGSFDASERRLEFIYDDWWRRWRMRTYDPIQEIPTVLSKTNATKYAAVMLTVTDMKSTFDLRMRLICEVNGTALAAGLCGFYRGEGSQWPTILSKIFPTYAVKRMNYDPFAKHTDSRGLPDDGPLEYLPLAVPVQVITEWGELTMKGCVLYAVGFDSLDEHAKESTRDGKGGDLVLWPPLRSLAREQDKLE